MQNYNEKVMKGTSAEENTEVTIRSIRDILAESGQEHLLLTSKDKHSRIDAMESPAQHANAQARTSEPPQPANLSAAKPSGSFAQRIANRFFGT